MLELTIIIVNWNTKDMLGNCLRSLQRSTLAPRTRIIVVDNNSRDGSTEMVTSDFPDVIVLNSGGNVGFGRANNLALPLAQSPFVLFLNPDTLIPEDSMEIMVGFMKKHQEVGALGCKMINAEGIVQNLGLQWFPSPLTELVKLLLLSQSMLQRLRSILPYHDPNSSGYIKKLYGGCFMIRKAVLDQLGGFDERFFMYGEDVDFSQRIFTAGWKLYYLTETWIVHLIGGAGSQASSDFSTLMMCESIGKLMEKHYGRIGSLSYRLVILLGSNIRLILLTLMRFFRFDGLSVNQLTRAKAKYGAMLRWSLNLQKPLIKP